MLKKQATFIDTTFENCQAAGYRLLNITLRLSLGCAVDTSQRFSLESWICLCNGKRCTRNIQSFAAMITRLQVKKFKTIWHLVHYWGRRRHRADLFWVSRARTQESCRPSVLLVWTCLYLPSQGCKYYAATCTLMLEWWFAAIAIVLLGILR